MSKNEIIQNPNLFKQFWNLMTLSFPKNEIRECEDFYSLAKQQSFATKIEIIHPIDNKRVIIYKP